MSAASEYDAPGESGDSNILEAPETLTHGPMSTLEQHLQRILGHLNTHAHHFVGGMASASASRHLVNAAAKRTEY